KAEIADKVIREIGLRLKFLNDVGLNYLSLDRSADTLSGGEAQRIRLASQIGSGLTGVMYVLGEPPIRPPQRGHTVRRRGAAHPAGVADRIGADRRDVRARRALDRPAPARQRSADRHA